MFKRIIPLLALAVLTLTGCSAVETHAESERLNAQAQLISAQARADNASAQLVAAQAMSQTLSAQTAQVERLTSEVVRQSQAQTMLALLALSVGIITSGTLAALIIVARMERQTRQEMTYYIARPTTPPQLEDPDKWPEVQARRRALVAARQERE